MSEHASQPTHEHRAEEEPAGEVNQAAVDAQREVTHKAAEDLDTILDEIDDVLEENAETFVRAYVQKGGQ